MIDINIKNEEGSPKEWPLDMGPLEGEHWSARSKTFRAPEDIYYWNRLWPKLSHLRPLSFPLGPLWKKRYIIGVGVLTLAFAVTLWLLSYPGKERRKVQTSGLIQATESPEKDLSVEKRYLETWYALTRADESEEIRIRATFEAPEKSIMEVLAKAEREKWPVDRQQEELKKITTKEGPFDHGSNYYFQIYMEVLKAKKIPLFLLQDPYSRIYLEDNRGKKAYALAPPGLEDRKAIFVEPLEAPEKPSSEAIMAASFYVAFPKERLSPNPRHLTLRASGLTADQELRLSWDLPAN